MSTPTNTPPEARQVPDSERKGGCSAMPSSDLARVLIMHAVDSMLTTCGNSYVNAYTEQWLDWAKQLGAYHGPVIGTIKDASEQWNDWLDENGGLPEIPDSPHWLGRMGIGQNDKLRHSRE
jgi:hypothetical protein